MASRSAASRLAAAEVPGQEAVRVVVDDDRVWGTRAVTAVRTFMRRPAYLSLPVMIQYHSSILESLSKIHSAAARWWK
jgi:hypothetical protein